jgi:hypothetical protein
MALLEKSRETPEVPRVRLMETPALVKAMIPLLWLLLAILASPFKSRCQLEAENAALRHQVIVLRRQVRGRIHLTNLDRLFLVQLYRWFPSMGQGLYFLNGAVNNYERQRVFIPSKSDEAEARQAELHHRPVGKGVALKL